MHVSVQCLLCLCLRIVSRCLDRNFDRKYIRYLRDIIGWIALSRIVVSADGVIWMGLTDDKLLYLSTCRNITLWHLNHFYSFWGLARNQVSSLSTHSCEEKSTRVLAVGIDSRLVSLICSWWLIIWCDWHLFKWNCDFTIMHLSSRVFAI